MAHAYIPRKMISVTKTGTVDTYLIVFVWVGMAGMSDCFCFLAGSVDEVLLVFLFLLESALARSSRRLSVLVLVTDRTALRSLQPGLVSVEEWV